MLSILIPIYNHNSNPLVQDLWDQAQALLIDFEIICLDDHSSQKYIDDAIINLPNVIYEELDNNLGRSKIRNLLASKAKYPQLIFLDCDGEIVSKDFLKNYLDSTCDVVYGGTIYTKQQPENKYLLHWTYAQKYEALNAELRKISPYLSFKTNNFMIKKEIFSALKFDETIAGYGYEDSLFAEELKRHHIQIHHIPNPVLHKGLNENGDFLDKVDEALLNLSKINDLDDRVVTHLTKTYNQWKKIGFINLLKPLCSWIALRIRRFLLKHPSNAVWLQIYKMMKWIEIKRPA